MIHEGLACDLGLDVLAQEFALRAEPVVQGARFDVEVEEVAGHGLGALDRRWVVAPQASVDQGRQRLDPAKGRFVYCRKGRKGEEYLHKTRDSFNRFRICPTEIHDLFVAG